MFKEFKEFALKGNLVDMAVGIIMGVAFGKVISSFVGDVIMPPIGRLLGGVDFSGLFLNLSGQPFETLKQAEEAKAAVIKYGVFINTVLDFAIVAFVMFLLIKAMNRLRKPAPAAAPTTRDCPFCLSAIPIKATRCPHCTSETKAA